MEFLGRKHTDETKRKMSEMSKGNKSRLGIPHTDETKRKISETCKRLGLKPPIMNGEKHPMWGKKHTEEAKRKMSEAKKGKRCGAKNHNWGKHLSAEQKQKLSEAHKGKKNYHWKGGISSSQQRIRASWKYNEWRQNIYLQDDFTCHKCGERGGRLHAHHTKPFSILIAEAIEYLPLFDEYEACMNYSPLWDVDNGITLCKKCHKELHKKRKKYA